jgi:WD40 repeat protein
MKKSLRWSLFALVALCFVVGSTRAQEKPTPLQEKRLLVINSFFSLDGQYIIAQYRNGSMKLWEVATGKLIYSSKPNSIDMFDYFTFSPDNTHILMEDDYYQAANVLDIKTGTIVYSSLKDTDLWAVKHLKFSKDGTYISGNIYYRKAINSKLSSENLVAYSRALVGIWDTSTWKLMTIPELVTNDGLLENSGELVGITEDGTRALVCGFTIKYVKQKRLFRNRYDDYWNNFCSTFEIKTGKQLVSFPPLVADGQAFNSQKSLFFSWSSDTKANIWDVNTGKSLFFINGLVNRVQTFNQDGSRLLIWLLHDTIQTYDIAAGKPLFYVSDVVGPLDDKKPFDYTGTRIARQSPQFSPSGSLLMVWTKGGSTFQVWDTTEGKLLFSCKNASREDPISVSLNKNETYILIHNNKITELRDVKTGAVVPSFQAKESAAFSPDGNKLITHEKAFDPKNNIYDIQTEKLLFSLSAFVGDLRATNEDASRALIVLTDGSAQLWDTTSNAVISPLPDW